MSLRTILTLVRWLSCDCWTCLLMAWIGISLEELGLRALERIPRDRAIDGIHAFNEMRCVSFLYVLGCHSSRTHDTTSDRLMAHLRPFAEEGRVVTEADIRGFFSDGMGAPQ